MWSPNPCGGAGEDPPSRPARGGSGAEEHLEQPGSRRAQSPSLTPARQEGSGMRQRVCCRPRAEPKHHPNLHSRHTTPATGPAGGSSRRRTASREADGASFHATQPRAGGKNNSNKKAGFPGELGPESGCVDTLCMLAGAGDGDG